MCTRLSSSPYVFSRVSDFIVRCAQRERADRVVNYLNNFCVMRGTKEGVLQHQQIVMGVLRQLGFFMSFKKLSTVGMSTRFLGIIIDSRSLELRLLEDILRKMLDSLHQMKGRCKVGRKELERVAGLLVHCTKVIRGLEHSPGISKT